MRLACAILVIMYLVSWPAFAKTEAEYGVSVKKWVWCRQDKKFADLAFPKRPGSGQTVSQMVKDNHAEGGVNGMYFDPGTFTLVGTVIWHGKDLTQCSLSFNRGFLWQTDRLEAGYYPPAETIFTIAVGPMLARNRVLVEKFPHCEDMRPNRKLPRTVVAINDEYFCLIIVVGCYRDVGRFLLDWGFKDVISLDGGSSSDPKGLVPNAVLIYDKSRPFYQTYSACHLTAHGTTECNGQAKPETKTANSQPNLILDQLSFRYPQPSKYPYIQSLFQ